MTGQQRRALEASSRRTRSPRSLPMRPTEAERRHRDRTRVTDRNSRRNGAAAPSPRRGRRSARARRRPLADQGRRRARPGRRAPCRCVRDRPRRRPPPARRRPAATPRREHAPRPRRQQAGRSPARAAIATPTQRPAASCGAGRGRGQGRRRRAAGDVGRGPEPACLTGGGERRDRRDPRARSSVSPRRAACDDPGKASCIEVMRAYRSYHQPPSEAFRES